MPVPSEAIEQLAQFQQHHEEQTVPEVAVYTSNSSGELETSKKLRVKITDGLRELASEEEGDAVHNHQLPVQSLTVFTQQAKRVKIQFRIKR